MPAGETIGQWTPTDLTKYIRDLFANQPPDFLPSLKAEEVQIVKKLVLPKEIIAVQDYLFRPIGAAGSPGFENSWVNFAGGWQVAGFWKDPLGVVHLRGLIKTGTIGQPAFTMPPGYRSAGNETFAVVSNSAFGRVDVQADGKIIPQSPSSNVFVSLSGISFRTIV